MALIRLFGGKDYTQRLKHQLLASVGLLLVGAVGLVCYFWLVPDSELTDFAQGFYIGAVLGITAGALITLVRCVYLLKNPEARQRAKVKVEDGEELLKPGDCHYCPKGHAHSLINDSGGELEFFAVVPQQ